MSRCFPYPPPGFERTNGVSDEALVESIKRGSEIAKKDRRKEKKREKKEKEKEKSRTNGEVEKKEHSGKKRHKGERGNVDQNGGDNPKRRENETEQLEKSGLTEEHGQPADTSDSTQNSSKRMKFGSPTDGIHNQCPGLRIRLPLLKHKDPEVPTSKEQPSTSGRSKTISQMKVVIASRPNEERPPSSTYGKIEIPAQDITKSAARSRFFESGSLEIESKFRDLIESWVPPPIQVECTDFDDQEWLFDMPHRHTTKKIKANDGASHGNFSLWPQACFMPEADIYALPYTVPY